MSSSTSTSAETDPASCTPAWCNEVVHFWCKTHGPDEWFTGGEPMDKKVLDTFGPLYCKLDGKIPDEAWTDPITALATVITFDQFPRNLYRKQAKAFATDPMALAVCKNAVAKGLDQGLEPHEKMFLWMPHVHSENMTDQDEAIRLLNTIADPVQLGHAEDHREIIRQFGRYPHRNECLGRTSTPEEFEWLASGGRRFGQ